MGYYLSAFIGRGENLNRIRDSYNEAIIVELSQGVSLIPLTEELFDEINNFEASGNILSFEYLTPNIERQILKIAQEGVLAYVEADYFGGEGGQTGIMWKDGKRSVEYKYGQGVINAALRSLAVICEDKKDEFDTLGLGRHRHTREWAESDR